MSTIYLRGSPSEKQQEFFRARQKYIAYGGARGGGKSWALRRKLVLMCLKYPGIRCLIIRRSYPELRENHILPLRSELKIACKYSDTSKCFIFKNSSRLSMGYLANDSDTLQYQGQEYDIIALDEATQLSEYQFSILKACIRGTNGYPKRMYLTCNPGGIGHGWVKRLFIDRHFRDGENPSDYYFIRALATDNKKLMEVNPDYINQLKSLPENLRQAWLYGKWDIFEGQFFKEFSRDDHICEPFAIPHGWRFFGGLDYGFDMTAFLLLCVDFEGNIYVIKEFYESNLTLSQASDMIANICQGECVEYIAASPDLWNRRQDTGDSGFEIMSRTPCLPSLIKADNRRIAGWRQVREYLIPNVNNKLKIFSPNTEIVRCLTALSFDKIKIEDASEQPHDITHLPEALRYALMSRVERAQDEESIYRKQKAQWERKRDIIYY